MSQEYAPLVLRRLSGPLRYSRPIQNLPARLKLDSPAIMTMTDLRQVTALTVEPDVSIDWALARMREGGVRLLLVVRHDDEIQGLITSTDILRRKADTPATRTQSTPFRYPRAGYNGAL